MALKYLALLVVAAAQEPRRLAFKSGDVSVSHNGVSNSPMGQFKALLKQAKAQAKMSGAVGQGAGGDPFKSADMGEPFGGDPFSNMGMGAAPKKTTAKGFALTPQNGATVLQGMIHSFLAHKQLEKGERDCLEQGTSAMGSQAAAVAQSIVMIGEETMQQSQHAPGMPEMPGMPGEAASSGQSGEDKLNLAQDMFDDIFNNAGATVPDSSKGVTTPPPLKPPSLNPFDMFKGFVNPEDSSPGPAPAPAAAPVGGVTDSMNIWGMSQGRRLQLTGGMIGQSMGLMPNVGSGGGGGNNMDPMVMMGSAAMAAQLAKQVQELGGLGHKVMLKCLRGDAQKALKTAAGRAQNPAWMQKAMVANGPKALGHIADAINAYHDGDAMKFGDSTGIVMREMLLNNADSIVTQALPDKKSLANVTGGFMKGFFGPGMTATIKTPEEPAGIKIDLDKCVGKNVGLFQSMWASVMQFYGKQGVPASEADKQKQATLLAYAAMQMPRALKMCNLGDEDIQAIKDAIAGMGKGVDMSVHIPKPSTPFSKTEAMADMAQTVSGYEKLVTDPSSGIDFGKKLGNLFQKVVENGFAQKYYVDSQGNLRKRLISLSSPGAGTQSLSALLASVMVLLLALIAFKSRRAFDGWRSHLSRLQGAESGATDRMISNDDLEV